MFFLVLGGIVLALTLEFGTLAQLFAAAVLVAVVVPPRGRLLGRLQRAGAYLLGGGFTGLVLLGWIVVRIRNVCGAQGGQVQSATGTSFECYSAETLWFVLGYGLLAAIGSILLYLEWRRRDTYS